MKKATLLAAAMVLMAGTVFAFGSHDNGCTDCHSLHYAKGAAIIGVQPGAMQNPYTNKAVADDLALCLGCHNDDEGIMPIMLKSTHPVGMKPNKVKVPKELLRKDGSLGCVSCHDPHPSNPNFQYLQGSVKSAAEMGKFCALCHEAQTDMNEFAPKKAAAPAKK